jgi:hypothetical protein
MADPTGETDRSALRLDFDCRLVLQFRGSTITSDAGLLAFRELDDILQLTDTDADKLADARTSRSSSLQAAHRVLPWRTVQPLALTFSSACWRPINSIVLEQQSHRVTTRPWRVAWVRMFGTRLAP